MQKHTHDDGARRSDDRSRVTELMARIVDGDEAAFFTLVDEFDRRVAYNVRQIVTDMGRRDILADEDEMGDLMALQGVSKYPVRVKCAVLAWDTLQKALEGREGRADVGANDPDAAG